MSVEPFACAYTIIIGEKAVAKSFTRAWPGESDPDTLHVNTKTETLSVRELGVVPDRRQSSFTFNLRDGVQEASFVSERFGSNSVSFKCPADQQADPSRKKIDWLMENNAVGLFELAVRLMFKHHASKWTLLCSDDGSTNELTLRCNEEERIIETSLGFRADLRDDFLISVASPLLTLSRSDEPFPSWSPTVRASECHSSAIQYDGISDERLVLSGLGLCLDGVICEPSTKEPTHFAVLIGGSGVHDKDGKADGKCIGYDDWSKRLATFGISVFRFDRYSAEEHCRNRTDALGFDDAVAQVNVALDFLKGRARGRPLILIGHSLGALIATATVARRSDVSVCCLLAAPAKSLREIIREQSMKAATAISGRSDHQAAILKLTEDVIAAQSGTSGTDNSVQGMTLLSRDALDLTISSFMVNPRTSYIIMHGEQDHQVSHLEAYQIKNLADQIDARSSIQILPERDHLFQLTERSTASGLGDNEQGRYEAANEVAKTLLKAITAFTDAPLRE